MRAMTRSVRPWCLKRRTSLIRRIDNLWVGIGSPHWLNEEAVARLSCRPKRPAPPKGAHDRLKSLLTIPRNAHRDEPKRLQVRIPIEAGQVFRGEAGHRSDLMSATI